MAKKVKRLFNEFRPTHYVLELTTNRTSMSFFGTVIISGQKVGRPSQRLTLHQKNLKLISARVTHHSKKGDISVEINRTNVHNSLEELRLHSKETLYPGNYTISLEFRGNITQQMNGIYPCNFTYKGKKETLIATQFESHFAREAFPCVDEPEAKATFDLIINAPKKDVVVSNTPINNSTSVKGMTRTEFITTPRMSTYLLAFVHGKLGYLEAKSKRGVTVRAYATPDNVAHTKFALNTAVKCLEFYEDYFATDFPLPKCDLVALPDFAVAGMENWGCITFSELALFVDNKHTSLSNKQLTAMVVAHEFAHMWFGNLVTMHWWTDLWLNESFASWIEYLALDHIFSEWNMWTQFNIDEQQQAMRFDSLEHTRPIEVPAINHPDEIRVSFDPPISYAKGASVINMLYHYIGAQAFKTGLRYYISKHAYSNTKTSDLWEALETASEKPVAEFMNKWISQPGFPLLRATIEDKHAYISQERYFINPKHSPDKHQTWPVVMLANNDKIDDILSVKNKEFKLSSNTGLKLNSGQSGFYRTAYNSTHLQHLGERIKRGLMPEKDRLGLLTDVTDSAKAGYLDTLDALNFLLFFEEESSYPVWDMISASIGSIRLVMDDEELREDMKPFIRKLVSKQLKRLGWSPKKNESHFDKLLRPVILGMAASADEPSVIKRTQQLFAKINHTDSIPSELTTIPSRRSVKRGGDIDPDLRGLVYSTAARMGGKKEYNKLLALYKNSDLSEEKITIAAALTSFKQPDLIAKSISMINSDDVRLQDIAYWVAYSFLNRHGKKQTWLWLKSNWQWLRKSIGTDLSFYYLPIYSARTISDEKFLTEYNKFFKSVMEPGLVKMHRRGVEMITWQSAWKKRALPEIKNFFKSQ